LWGEHDNVWKQKDMAMTGVEGLLKGGGVVGFHGGKEEVWSKTYRPQHVVLQRRKHF